MLPKPPRQLGFQQLTPFRMQKKTQQKHWPRTPSAQCRDHVLLSCCQSREPLKRLVLVHSAQLRFVKSSSFIFFLLLFLIQLVKTAAAATETLRGLSQTFKYLCLRLTLEMRTKKKREVFFIPVSSISFINTVILV